MATEKNQEISELISVVGGRGPLYMQVMEELEKLIKGRKIKPGVQLPSEEALTKILGVSRSTVREALGYLETQGLIFRKHGSGTFVTHSTGKGFLGGLERLEPFREIARRAGLTSKVVERQVSQVNPDDEMVSALGNDPDSTLIRVEIIEAINGVRTMYLVDYLKESCGTAGALTKWNGSVLTFLEKECDPALTHTRTEIFAVGADKIVASKLNIPEGKPIQYQVETYYSGTGDVLGIGYLYILTEHFHFFVNRRVS